MKLILHIGTPKSGTTYIQNALIANQAVLKGENIYYIHPENQRIAPMAEVAYLARHDSYFWNRHTFGRQQFIRQQISNLTYSRIFDEFVELIKKHESSDSTLIISSENLCFLTSSSIELFLKLFPKVELYIIETRKPVPNLLRSLYWQTSKIEQISSYGDFIRHFSNAFKSKGFLYTPFFYLNQEYLKIWTRYGQVRSVIANKIQLKDFLVQAECNISNFNDLREPQCNAANSTPPVNFVEAVKIFHNLHPNAHLSCSNKAINKSRLVYSSELFPNTSNQASIPLISVDLASKIIQQYNTVDKIYPDSQLSSAFESIESQYQSLINLEQVSDNYRLIEANYNKLKSALYSLSSKIIFA